LSSGRPGFGAWKPALAHSKNQNQVLKDKMSDITQYDPVIKQVLTKMKIKRDHREDMAQECYVALLENQDRLGGDDHLTVASGICQSTIYRILSALGQYDTKKENRIRFISSDIPAVAHSLSKIGIEDTGPVSESELYAAIETLNPEDGEAIKATFVNGLTQEKAAEKLNISRRTLCRRQNRGIIALRQKLEV
jgi:RNA polymerase sigma factor (sigma-70 family)